MTQRVELVPVGEHPGDGRPPVERRDALDLAWYAFLAGCALAATPLPNDERSARRVLAAGGFDGLLLTGGNDLAALGGDAPERDAVETLALRHALAVGLPVLGVCRGMQLVLERFGATLERVEGHAGRVHALAGEDVPAEANSYHRWGAREVPAELEVVARAADGVVEAVRHRELALAGIMWHPERYRPFRAGDRALFRSCFAAARGGEEPRAGAARVGS